MPNEELLKSLAESITMVRDFLTAGGASLDDVQQLIGFARNAAIDKSKEVANRNDESRKRFEIICREVFKRFKACLNIAGVKEYRADHAAISAIYKSLEKDKYQADISEILKVLYEVIDKAILPGEAHLIKEMEPYDISKIDFDRLKQEFAKYEKKASTVMSMKDAVQSRLDRMMKQNPLRTNFQTHYEKIVADYNGEKDRVTIEQTFEELLRFVKDLKEEDERAAREGLDEESLAIFDLLRKETLDKAEIERIKEVATELLKSLKAEKLKIEHWQEREATRDAVKTMIHDFLYGETLGLPAPAYSEVDVKVKTQAVYEHVLRVYPSLPSPFFQGSPPQSGASYHQ